MIDKLHGDDFSVAVALALPSCNGQGKVDRMKDIFECHPMIDRPDNAGRALPPCHDELAHVTPQEA